MRRLLPLLAAAALACGTALAAVPEAVPDLPVLGAAPLRGPGVATTPSAPVTPAPKAADGAVSDWIGAPTRLAGTAIYSAGEYVYQDYLMDDRGADDGVDAARRADLDPIEQAEPRTYRAEALYQAAGDQFGAPRPPAANSFYGDAVYPAGLGDHADLEEVRVGTGPTSLFLLARTTGMTVPGGTAVLVLLDTAPGGSFPAPGGLTTGAETSFVAAGGGCATVCPAGMSVATNATDFVNAVEISVPRAGLPAEVGVGVVAGVMSGGSFVPFNVAFRDDEPIRVWRDQAQAFALRDGSIDKYLARVDLAKLDAGYTETWTPRPGYYEKIYETDSPVVRETESNGYFQGSFQHYGLYIPTAYEPGSLSPATFWLHYRGGRAHDAAAWVPGLIRQLGEARGNVVVTPGARGTSSWYSGRGHEDFLDVWDDVMASLSIDPDRVYVSGYSMGGYGSYLLGLLYPDRFAGAFPTAGPPTVGAFTGIPGVGPLNTDGSDPVAMLTFPLVENARNLPYVIFQGTNDELVPVSGTTRQALRFAELGYRYRLYLFAGHEHYTTAIVDEWMEAARYLDGFRRDPNPSRVTYRVMPALERAIETYRTPSGTTLDYAFDGAYWVDDLAVRDGSPTDPATLGAIDAQTFGRAAEDVLTVPEAGAGPSLGQASPWLMQGVRWHHAATLPALNRFTATLTNLSAARLDVARMALSTTAPITATVTTDGAATLRLAGTWAGTPSVIGASGTYDGAVLTITLPAAGSYDLTIGPG